jgi:hypothetical protein
LEPCGLVVGKCEGILPGSVVATPIVLNPLVCAAKLPKGCLTIFTLNPSVYAWGENFLKDASPFLP